MVGIPGRSKACHTCLMRRKACDLQHPVCKQCQRLGRECAWYKRQAIFVNTTVKTARRAKQNHSSLSITREQYPCQQAPLTQLSESLHLSAIQSQCLDLFWEVYLPRGRPISPEIPICCTVSWIMVARAAAGRNHNFTKLAVTANSLCMLGIQHGDETVLREGRKLYGRALLQMVEELRNLGDKTRPSLILNARLLGLFEIFFGQEDLAQGQAWTGHNSGERCLVLGGDPRMYSRGEAHQVFVDGRLHLIGPNIFNRKASVFGKPEWKTVPWHEMPKTPKDLLLDIYVEIPGLFETFNQLQEEGFRENSSGDLIQHLVCKCLQVRDELKIWYDTTGFSIESYIGKVMAEEEKMASIEHMASAQLLVLYWCCLLHYTQLRQEIFNSEQIGIQSQIFSLPPPTEDAQVTCRNILRAMAMFLSPCSGWFGINVAVFPMGVILNHIQGVGSVGVTYEERRMLYKLLETPKGRLIAGFAKSLKWMGNLPTIIQTDEEHGIEDSRIY